MQRVAPGSPPLLPALLFRCSAPSHYPENGVEYQFKENSQRQERQARLRGFHDNGKRGGVARFFTRGVTLGTGGGQSLCVCLSVCSAVCVGTRGVNVWYELTSSRGPKTTTTTTTGSVCFSLARRSLAVFNGQLNLRTLKTRCAVMNNKPRSSGLARVVEEYSAATEEKLNHEWKTSL